jgi:hypothetical protein
MSLLEKDIMGIEAMRSKTFSDEERRISDCDFIIDGNKGVTLVWSAL